MTARFGTDGLRGEAGVEPITVPQALAVGHAAGRWAVACGLERVVVGRDPRPSSAGFAAAAVAGAAAAGVDVLDLGMVPTPVVGVALASGLGGIGVMVTASHNPAKDNGFKVLGPGGRKPLAADVEQLEGWMAQPLSSGVPGRVRSGHDEALDAWEAAARRVLPPLPERSIVIDLAHGAAVAVMERVRGLWPGPVAFVGAGGGAVNDGVGSEHIESLGAAVRAAGAWAGLAVDGDGDRCRLVDADGVPVAGDALTWLLARGMGVEGLAVTVMSTTALELQLPGVKVVRTPVGDKHLAAAMRDHSLPLGAEESGHVLFADYPAGDGLLAGMRALATVGDRTVADAVGRFELLPRKLGKLRVGSRPPLDTLAGVQRAIAEATPELGAGGRVFLRYSGTEPVLRILVEGSAADGVERAYRAVEAAALAALT